MSGLALLVAVAVVPAALILVSLALVASTVAYIAERDLLDA